MLLRRAVPLATTFGVLSTLSSLTSFSFLSTLSSLAGLANGQVTVYSQVPLGHLTADPARVTLGAYDQILLTPPALPEPMPANTWTLELDDQVGAVYNGAGGASIQMVHGAWWGFSVEMSVIIQVLGRRSTHINVPFLNLMSLIEARGGQVRIRMGGNTQEYAIFTGDTVPGHGLNALGKERLDSGRTTLTPAVQYSLDWFYMMTNVSSLVNVGWYLGIPFQDTAPFRLDIVRLGVEMLGDRLLALQGGNEPDFYFDHGLRSTLASYGPADYANEFGELVTQLEASGLMPRKQFLLGPSVSNIVWNSEQVFETGYLDRYDADLSAITVERYPHNNCNRFGDDPSRIVNPQDRFGSYLTHNDVVGLVNQYLGVSRTAQERNKPLYMFETNTASCGGFPGISNSMGAALWVLDYGLQMAFANFSGALLHVGGQDTYYNPFTSPPTNQSAFDQWTIGAVYYSSLIMAEMMGHSNTSQVVDLRQAGQTGVPEEGDGKFPQYGIYERGKLSKVALFNYYTAPGGPQGVSGGGGAGGWGAPGQYTANLHLNGATMPDRVWVKYLTSSSVSQREDMAWAGQSLGPQLKSDGRFVGELNITEIRCDPAASTCQIPVPAPAFALVFLTEEGVRAASPEQGDGSNGDGNVQTYSTSAVTRTRNTATVDEELLATSNGHSGKDRSRFLGSTSVAGLQSGAVIISAAGILSVLAVTAGAVVVLM